MSHHAWKRVALVAAAVAVVGLAAGGLGLAAGSSTSLDNNVNESAGLVTASGGKCSACVDPFTVQYVSTGQYRILYPSGVWNHAGSLPVPVVTAFNGADIRGRVIGLGFGSDGSLTFRAQFVNAAGTPVDTDWFFTVTQP